MAWDDYLPSTQKDIDDLIGMFEDAAGKEYGYAPFGDDLPDGVGFVAEASSGSGRWVEYMTTVVRYNSELYGVDWSRGLTEIQEDEFYPDRTSIYPVVETEKVIRVYNKV